MYLHDIYLTFDSGSIFKVRESRFNSRPLPWTQLNPSTPISMNTILAKDEFYLLILHAVCFLSNQIINGSRPGSLLSTLGRYNSIPTVPEWQDLLDFHWKQKHPAQLVCLLLQDMLVYQTALISVSLNNALLANVFLFIATFRLGIPISFSFKS